MTRPKPPIHLDASAIRELGEPGRLVDALADGLRGALRPDDDPPRTSMPTEYGELLLMPAAGADYAGVKVLGLAPGNSARGLPPISGLYLLLEARTLRPVATLDGAELTACRTAAVSALAVRHLTAGLAGTDGFTGTAVVFGTGVQAAAHLETLHALYRLTEVVVVGRDRRKAEQLLDRLALAGTVARAGGTADLSGAGLVVCCTNAREPLFEAGLLAADAVVVAVGSHHPDARELGPDVMAAADLVVVETRQAAEREAGDVVQAAAAGALRLDDVVELADLVHCGRTPRAGLRVFKSVGMAWEDLVVATTIYERAAGTSRSAGAPIG